MNIKRLGMAVVFCALGASLITGCGGGDKKAATGGNAAKGEVNLYTSQPEADAQKLIAAFNKKHPDIKVKVFRSGTEEVISKVMAEKKMGKVQADMLLVADAASLEQLKAMGVMAKYESAELKNIPAELADKDHTYVGTKVMATGIIYNKNLVKEAPKGFKDLTAPAYAGKGIMPSPLYSGAASYNLSIFTDAPGLGWDFYKGLKANGITVDKGNGSVLKAVSEGNKGVGMIVDYMAFRAKAKGAPVEFVYPLEGAPVITEPIGIVKGSANEKQAQLFEDFILSEEGQTITSQIGYTPVRKGVKAPEGFKTMEQIKILAVNMAEVVKHREEDKKQFTELFK